MAVNRWRGDAQARRQVDRIVITDPEVGDTFTITCNRKDVVATAEDLTESGAATIQTQLYQDLVAQIGTSATDAEFKELVAAVEYPDGDTSLPAIGMLIYGAANGAPFEISVASGDVGDLGVSVVESIKGVAGVNEQQTVTLESTVNGGTFTLTYEGQTTAAIAWNASAATMVTRLEALSNIGVGDVAVTGGSGTAPWVITFQGVFANTDVSLLTADGSLLTLSGAYSISVSTLVQGNAGLNENQQINIGFPTSGTFTLTFSGQVTAGIAWNASAATIQTALEALSNIAPGDVVVSEISAANGRRFKVIFSGVYRNTNVPQMTGNGSGLDGWSSVSVTTMVQGETVKPAHLSFDINEGFRGNYFYIRVWDCRTGVSATRQVAMYGYCYALAWDSSANVAGRLYNAIGTYIRELADGAIIPWGNTLFHFELQGDFLGIPVYTSIGDAETNLGLFIDIVDINGATLGDSWQWATDVVVEEQALPAGVNEVQKVTLFHGPTGGTFTLTFQGQVTGAIAYNASAATVQTALEALSNIAPGDVTVTGSAGGPWTCTFGGVWASTDLQQMTGQEANLTGNSISVTTTQQATPYTNEKQKVQVLGGPAGGTFTLTWNGVTTAAIAYNASAAVVEAAIELAFSAGFTVTGAAGGPWTLEFSGSTILGANQTQMTGNGASLTGSQPDVAETRAAVQPVNEEQIVSLLGGPGSGTFTLTYAGQVTAAIPYNASASVVRNALIALSNIGPSDVSVSGDPGGSWSVTFISTLAATDVVLMTGDGTGLSPGLGTQDMVLTHYIIPTGPNWVNEGENWSLNHALADTEIGVAEDNAVDMLYGLDQMSGVTPAKLIFKGSYTGKVGLPDWTGNYVEYRPRKLRIGTAADAATITIEIGEGPGEGPSRLRLDTGDCPVVIECKSTAAPANGEQAAFDWVGTAAANIVRCYHTIGRIAGLEGELATIATLVVAYISNQDSDVTLLIGDGVTIGAVTKTGGILTTHSSLAGAFQQLAGTTYVEEAAGASALTLRGGRMYYNGSGTLGGNPVLSGDAVLDFSQDMRTKTITNPIDVYGDTADVYDPWKVANGAGSLIIDYNETTRSPQLGRNYRITRAATA